jgi:ferrous iron transport protein B
VLFAAIFFPGAASLVILGLYLLGMIVAILVGLALQRTLLPATDAPGLVMELPPYRMPHPRSLRFHVWLRTRSFLRHAASLILMTTLAIWLLTVIPLGGGAFADTPMADSAFGRLSSTLTPVVRPLGFGSWQASGALISGLVAKEVVVSTLAQTYGAGEETLAEADISIAGDLGEIAQSFGRALVATLKAIPGLIGINPWPEEEAVAPPGLAMEIRASFEAASGGRATAAGLAFMVFVLLYTPCMAAIAAERHELGGRWAALTLVGQLAIAWVVAFLVFRAGAWLGGG